jgi:UDP-glucose 4-epimerase
MINKNVLVIGGSGFLGSHVADALTDAGYIVKILDRYVSKWLRNNQEMVIGDILDQDLLLRHTKNCVAVYNFAAVADLNEAILKPVETTKINVLGNVMILEACRVNKVKRYVYASTVYVHSREGGFYRCSKKASEEYVEEYQKSYGLDYTILRYGSLYGPRSDEHNGLWRVVKDVLENGVVKYEGNIESVREYIHVEDAAVASVIALGDEFKNEHVVLTGHEPLRVIDMLKMLSEIMGIKQEVQFENLPYQGHYIRTPYAYQTKLGKKFKPPMHIDLGQGLIQLIEDVRYSITKDD